ncbi:MAG: DNA repair protein RecN, partial [Anaerolineae bacterium]|nr:DNA repair protein RecN [Anaerolineae bacterium]
LVGSEMCIRDSSRSYGAVYCGCRDTVLTELRIQDFAIIDRLHLTFEPGLCVLTGETGAGKSIIVDAVDMVLGGRADSGIVRAGAERAIVEATFYLSPAQQREIVPLLEQEGLEGECPEWLSLGREVRANGRTISRINGRAVTLTLLREVAARLVDIHGQSEHLSLLRVREHINLLDRYAELWPLRSQVAQLAERVRAVRRELETLLRSEQELAHRSDLLNFQINEIAAAALRPGEEEELLEERLRLANVEQLAELSGEALHLLEGDERGSAAVLDLLGAAIQAIEGLARIDPALEAQLQLAESAGYQLEELARTLRHYREQLEYNPRRLQDVEERLAIIRRLERKYGPTIADVLEYARQAALELETITHSEERIAALREEEERLLTELGKLAVELSLRRREAARRLAVGIEEELRDLRMEGARFGVDFQWREDPEGVPLGELPVADRQLEAEISRLPSGRVAFDSTGIDQVEFLISPNPGEPLKPLAKIASGGETSRLMLALKTVLSRADETPTLIFDEIDQGIGGRVGATVGEKLWRLTVRTGEDGATHQVLCVTHLPQLAGFGDVHYHVEKHVEQTPSGERTVTRVRRLEGRDRVNELASMLGASGEAAYRSAEEILEYVKRCKER